MTNLTVSEQSLPINAVLDELLAHLAHHHRCILQAEPGAGKTTRVPLVLLQQPWLSGQKIIMLEPRRIAARNAAEFMAQQLGERCGQTIGYRMRQDNKVSAHTRVEVVTEGVFARMLSEDPSLEGIGLVIFDEFHERSLDSDVSLALCLQASDIFRDELPLKLLVMSATLDLPVLQTMLACPVVSSAGRSYPVDIIYSEQNTLREDIVVTTVTTVQRALAEQLGSILVFLPGQAEIDRVVSLLNESLGARLDIFVCPLYGMLSLAEQRRAIEPSPVGVRKVVLATNIAESSLTIDGIHVVIDSGWARVSRFDPRTAMNRLHTQRVSQASTTQRAGRAGRLGPGVCYRLWTQQQQHQLNSHEAPEIMQSDLMPTVLQLLAWGCADINELAWLTPPPLAAFNSARQLLFKMGLVNHNDQRAALTDLGEAATKLPLHPRLGHMLLVANKHGAGLLACKIVALLEERDPLRNAQTDLELRLDWLDRQRQGAATKHWQRIKQLQRLLGNEGEGHSVINGYAAAEILALGFPDRIAQCRAVKSLDYKLANGRGAELSEGDRLQGSEYLVIADLGGRTGSSRDRIFMAASLDPRVFETSLASLVETVDYNQWDDKTETLLAEQRQMCGQLVLARKSLPKPSQEQLKQGLLAWVAKRGLSILPWREKDQQWLARLRLARQYCGDLADWPDVSDSALSDGLTTWLGPFLNGVQSAKQLQQIKLQDALHAMLAWPLQQKLDDLLPPTVLVPTGRQVTIDYLGERPVLAIKLQEMFGCPASPQIAAGRLPLTLHLLSPAQRPLAVTADLASFWANAYQDVKKDMKGRYPKHYWPDDPMQAEATKYTKKGPRLKD